MSFEPFPIYLFVEEVREVTVVLSCSIWCNPVSYTHLDVYKRQEFQSIVFLRHDVYDLMMNQTSDRGKSGQVSIDWTDRAKLAQVLYLSLIHI